MPTLIRGRLPLFFSFFTLERKHILQDFFFFLICDAEELKREAEAVISRVQRENGRRGLNNESNAASRASSSFTLNMETLLEWRRGKFCGGGGGRSPSSLLCTFTPRSLADIPHNVERTADGSCWTSPDECWEIPAGGGVITDPAPSSGACEDGGRPGDPAGK